MNQIRLGFLSSHNYFDKNAWSGIVSYMYKALKSTDMEIVDLGNPKKPNLWRNLVKKFWQKDRNYKIGSDQYIHKNTQFANLVKQQISNNQCDAIFSPVGSKELYFLETNIPILYFSGMTFKLYQESYSLNFTQEELNFLEKQELAAISKATRLVYPSSWPINSAINDYKADPNKIKVVSYGANLDNPPSPEEIFSLKKSASSCRLLFIGKDWERKGGDIAVETFITLNKMGIDTELIIVGSVPPTKIKHKKITIIPFLNKNKPQEMEKFRELLLKSHFLIFPTRAEAFGVVNCEANAFGLPVITTEVGGLPTIVKNGKNGYMLPLSASGKNFAELIAEIFSDQSRYQELVRSSRQEYDTRLNWNSWAKSIRNLIVDML